MVELLVVIIIIGLLAAILVTAVGGAREAARRTQCIARQGDLAKAMIAYSVANKGLPGYLEQPTAALPLHSWAVAIMPEIGESKRYEVLMRTAPPAQPPEQVTATLPALICPSDNPQGTARLNYVVNCGPSAAVRTNNSAMTGEDALYFTLFKDRRTRPDTSPDIVRKKVLIEEIPDGAGNTILLTENSDPRVDRVWYENWASFGLDSAWKTASGDPIRSRDSIVRLGFVWWRDNDFLPNAPEAGNNVSRPSSKHPGTVVAAFADGSARPINDDISIDEWMRAVCPDDSKGEF